MPLKTRWAAPLQRPRAWSTRHFSHPWISPGYVRLENPSVMDQKNDRIGKDSIFMRILQCHSAIHSFFRLDVARCYWGPRMKPIDLDGRWPKRNGARSLRIKRRPLPGQDWESMGQWEFQDPKMEVLYHILGHIFWGYSLKFRPYVW